MVLQQPAENPSSATGRTEDEDDGFYRCLVVDAGPIIKLSGTSTLWNKARSFYTVPGVVQEIRDAKARHHLDHLPFELIVKEPSPTSIQVIVDFARKTGDYQSLSSVDLQVLALTYELEKEGCHGIVTHLRTEPKRMVGVGKLQMLAAGSGSNHGLQQELAHLSSSSENNPADNDDNNADDESDDEEDDDKNECIPPNEKEVSNEQKESSNSVGTTSNKPSCWAALLNPNSVPPSQEQQETNTKPINVSIPAIASSKPGGANQFDDAEEVEDLGNNGVAETAAPAAPPPPTTEPLSVEDELKLDFPSLSASATVPMADDDGAQNEVIDEEERKRRSLQPITKSGKLYNSVPVAKHLARRTPPKPSINKESGSSMPKNNHDESSAVARDSSVRAPTTVVDDDDRNQQSRIMGGSTFTGQENDVEDDGEGWISTVSEIHNLKSNGSLNLGKGHQAASAAIPPAGPPLSQRTACTTTDFAMQNVTLQMNLELLSVDGMRIKKVKSWVRRCGACFKVYTDSDDTGPITGKRLFCEKCGSDMIQRIACSVDAKTGRLRLHLKKNYKHNLRGTKFSLPKPGSGDRFQGDLLLREDQLLTGTWGQKAKMCGGGKAKAASESIFGRDIAKNMGCHVNSLTATDEIQVGFGRRNPNAAKGRERRGKKKKNTSRACGLRRY